MSANKLDSLRIRGAVVRRPDLGFILACDPKKEEKDIAHTILFKWKAGDLTRGEAGFNAHTSCIIEYPEYGVLRVSGSGIYSTETRSGSIVKNLFENSQPKPKEPRFGDIRSVTQIDGRAHAVGLDGMVYRLDDLELWTRIDEGLPNTFDIEAIDGFSGSDIYAAGYKGEAWRFDGRMWKKCELPTNVILGSVKCAGDENVYIGGNKGILIRGREDSWEIIDHEATTDTLWDLEWFDGALYSSTMSNVFRLEDDRLEAVDFDDDPPQTCYQLSSADGVMWSVGGKDIMSFDGTRWTRVI